jgi:glucose/arabinose dehydrogenase
MRNCVYIATILSNAVIAAAQPTVIDNNLAVRTIATGLMSPTTMAFLGPNELFVLEKATGKVQHVVDGVVQPTPALDLAVNNAVERGLLGIALDPAFTTNHYVYLYWTCNGTAPVEPEINACSDPPGLGADTNVTLDVPLLGNRVDRFLWNGTSLTYVQNLIKLHAYQNDGAPNPPGQGDTGQPAAGNHNAGVIRFGPDGKLYIIIGDNGRRGKLQNLPSGPTLTGLGDTVPDDQFGGPSPDNAHFTGVIIRLNPDGTIPTDNPFYAIGAQMGGEAGANIQKIFAYGFRNSFGMAFDPISGDLWMSENGDDTFDELNRVTAGFNSGWVQVMGPLERISQFKAMETSFGSKSLQQLRWPPTRIADTAEEAVSRMFLLPGAHFENPMFSWRWAVAPAAVGFLSGSALGPQYAGDLFVGGSTPALEQGYLFRFQLTGNRQHIGTDDLRLADRVADNLAKFEITESESLLFGRNFGVVTDIQTGPNGNLFVVSLTKGEIYEIHRVR